MKAYRNGITKTQFVAELKKHQDETDLSFFIRTALSRGYLKAKPKTGFVFNRYGRQITTKSVAGYFVGSCRIDGVKKQIKIHQVIWIASFGYLPNRFVLDHINRVKTDNRIKNLRLVSCKLNSQNRRSYSGSNNPAFKVDKNAVLALRVLGFSYQKIATQLSCSPSNVARICRNYLSQKPRGPLADRLLEVLRNTK
jgi:hypothetical protein